MSEFRIDQITNQSGSRGPDIAGITTFTGTSGMVMPSGSTFRRDALENMVERGLVLYLDAANSNSYNTGISTSTWYDLSGQQNNGTLFNGTSYSSADGGSFSFDGVNDYIDCGSKDSLNLTTGFTVSFWMKNTDISGFEYLVNRWTYSARNYRQWSFDTGGSSSAGNNWELRFRISNDGTDAGVEGRACKVNRYYRAVTNSTIGNNKSLTRYENPDIADGNWHNICGTWNGSTQSLYIDGIFMGSTTKTSMVSTPGRKTFIGGGNDGTALNMSGNISQVSIYNRALSDVEIGQNFNAFRNRYGV